MSWEEYARAARELAELKRAEDRRRQADTAALRTLVDLERAHVIVDLHRQLDSSGWPAGSGNN